MGVRYNREYSDIVRDLGAALGQIDNCCDVFEMERDEWNGLEQAEQTQFLHTLADDIFYGLGTEPRIVIGSGKVQYDAVHHTIRVWTDEQIVHLIKLV